MSREGRSFVLLAVALLAGLAAYLYRVKTRAPAGGEPGVAASPEPAPPAPSAAPDSRPDTAVASPRASGEASGAPPTGPAVPPAADASPRVPASTRTPHQILFRHTGRDHDYGKLALADLDDVARRRFVGGISCRVVSFAAGTGICLQADPIRFAAFAAQFFDGEFRLGPKVALPGLPSRTRVAPSGRLAAATVFVSGHSYAAVGFSTTTLLFDTTDGRVLADLETFAVSRDGAAFREQDFNFWGVTFTPDSQGFYCTLSSGGRHHLVRGDVARRTASVIFDNVECPSLSPDGTRVAYKKRQGGGGPPRWQLQVLELASLRETVLGEERSVDDQLEWLDDGHVLYAVPDPASAASTDVWMVAADGRSAPTRFLPNAYSPALMR